MGRYYNGDIEGKFWFALQGSDVHERFGARMIESNYVEYCINYEEYDNIVEELRKIETETDIHKVKSMFEEVNGYNDDTLKKYNVSRKELSEYADWCTGRQVKEWFDANPKQDCYFTAEY